MTFDIFVYYGPDNVDEFRTEIGVYPERAAYYLNLSSNTLMEHIRTDGYFGRVLPDGSRVISVESNHDGFFNEKATAFLGIVVSDEG